MKKTKFQTLLSVQLCESGPQMPSWAVSGEVREGSLNKARIEQVGNPLSIIVNKVPSISRNCFYSNAFKWREHWQVFQGFGQFKPILINLRNRDFVGLVFLDQSINRGEKSNLLCQIGNSVGIVMKPLTARDGCTACRLHQ